LVRYVFFFHPGKIWATAAQQSHHVWGQGTSERGDERKDVHGNTIKKALLLPVGGGHGNLVLSLGGGLLVLVQMICVCGSSCLFGNGL